MPDLHRKAQSCLLFASDTKLAGLGVEACCLLKLMLVLSLTWMIIVVAFAAELDDRCAPCKLGVQVLLCYAGLTGRLAK